MNARSPRRVRGALAIPGLLLATLGCTPAQVDQVAVVSNPARTAPVCDHVEPGPATPPAGAVTVDPAVDDDLNDKTKDNPPGTTFWLAPGTHTLGDDQYGQVSPKDGNTYIGAPGAILDGRGRNMYAFVFTSSDVTISHLTVRGFIPPPDQGVVNHDSGNGWVIEHNTIEHNGGAGMMAGARQKVIGNCLRQNGQYGMNAAQAGDGITGLIVEGNEFVGNNTDDWESRVVGCGCTGAMKFWGVQGADVRRNWIHDNRGPGLWADTNNNDFIIEQNLFENNDGAAIFYETSYNAVIRDNTMRRNNLVEGRGFVDRGDSFPAAAIYLSEAGGEPRVKARTDKIEIYNNDMENNWSGITLWENADRFCNSPANTSTGYCTRLVQDPASCSHPGITTEPLLGDCRWKTQRVDIHNNRFALDPKAIGCQVMCGRMALISNSGTFPEWSPYKDDTVEKAITFDQENRWHDNKYSGPWTFMPHDTGGIVDVFRWQDEPYRQDKGSTFTLKGGA